MDKSIKILPNWTFWGSGVVLVTKEQWLKSESKIEAILKQLHRAKLRVKDDKEIVALKAENKRLKKLLDDVLCEVAVSCTLKYEIKQALKG